MIFFCDFNKPGVVAGARATKKGAVLALLRQRASGRPLLVVAAHPSVPLASDGHTFTPEVPIAEMKQLIAKVGYIQPISCHRIDRSTPQIHLRVRVQLIGHS